MKTCLFALLQPRSKREQICVRCLDARRHRGLKVSLPKRKMYPQISTDDERGEHIGRAAFTPYELALNESQARPARTQLSDAAADP
jgi:hypothetical protein